MNDIHRAVIALLAIPLLVMFGVTIKTKIDQGGKDNARMYNTALQADEKSLFNYTIDSRQGNMLGSGQFTATQPVKFDEMKSTYSAVYKHREEYTMHTETYGCGTTESPQTCTSTYWSWDYDGTEERVTPDLELYGRSYPALLFTLSDFDHSTNTCEIVNDHCSWDGYYSVESDVRYYYTVVDASFQASFIANVRNGTLEPIKGSVIKLEQRDVDTIVKDANNYGAPGVIFMVIWCILVVSGAGYLAYWWTENY